MKRLAALASLAILTIFTVWSGAVPTSVVTVRAESPTATALEHVRKACEAVWTKASPDQIQRCTDRAMGALGDAELARYRDLERLLQDSQSELQACEAELHQLRGEGSTTKPAGKKGDTPTPR